MTRCGRAEFGRRVDMAQCWLQAADLVLQVEKCEAAWKIQRRIGGWVVVDADLV
jgi:hypothetical protein